MTGSSVSLILFLMLITPSTLAVHYTPPLAGSLSTHSQRSRATNSAVATRRRARSSTDTATHPHLLMLCPMPPTSQRCKPGCLVVVCLLDSSRLRPIRTLSCMVVDLGSDGDTHTQRRPFAHLSHLVPATAFVCTFMARCIWWQGLSILLAFIVRRLGWAFPNPLHGVIGAKEKTTYPRDKAPSVGRFLSGGQKSYENITFELLLSSSRNQERVYGLSSG